MKSLARGILRYAGLILRFVRYRGRLRDRPVFVCLSSDFDPWRDKVSREGWEIYERMLARRGLSGRITYLVNPILGMKNDPDVYEAIAASGCEIGLHCHLERLVMEERKEELRAEMERQKRLVEETFRPLRPDFAVSSFRSGSRAHSRALFETLAELGIRYESSLSHLENVRRVYDWDVDDRGTPPRPYRMEPSAPKTEAGPGAPLVELPVSGQIPDLGRLVPALRPGEPLVVVTFTHPYNFATDGRRNLPIVVFIAIALFFLRRLPNVEFLHMSEAGRRWEEWRRTGEGAKS